MPNGFQFLVASWAARLNSKAATINAELSNRIFRVKAQMAELVTWSLNSVPTSKSVEDTTNLIQWYSSHSCGGNAMEIVHWCVKGAQKTIMLLAHWCVEVAPAPGSVKRLPYGSTVVKRKRDAPMPSMGRTTRGSLDEHLYSIIFVNELLRKRLGHQTCSF